MKTYQAIKAEIAKLEKQADELRQIELATVIAATKKTIAEYSLTPSDLGFTRVGADRRKATGTQHKQGIPKYADPKTGKTWTGRGKPPNWILGAKNRDAFLIKSGSS
jgi:DNA-binding protein H-NS